METLNNKENKLIVYNQDNNTFILTTNSVISSSRKLS